LIRFMTQSLPDNTFTPDPEWSGAQATRACDTCPSPPSPVHGTVGETLNPRALYIESDKETASSSNAPSSFLKKRHHNAAKRLAPTASESNHHRLNRREVDRLSPNWLNPHHLHPHLVGIGWCLRRGCVHAAAIYTDAPERPVTALPANSPSAITTTQRTPSGNPGAQGSGSACRSRAGRLTPCTHLTTKRRDGSHPCPRSGGCSGKGVVSPGRTIQLAPPNPQIQAHGAVRNRVRAARGKR